MRPDVANFHVMRRPGIGNVVRAVARQFHNPTSRRWKSVIQIIHYLLGTKDLDLTFFRVGIGHDSVGLADANYTDKADDRRSVSRVAATSGNIRYELVRQHVEYHCSVDRSGRVHSNRRFVCKASVVFHRSVPLREILQRVCRQR